MASELQALIGRYPVKIKESLTNEEWILIIGLNQRINRLLHDMTH